MKRVERTFIPGSNWLYYKIYTGDSTADRILSDKLYKTIIRLKSYYDKFFFIRYADPEFHIRLRFYVLEQQSLASIILGMDKILEPLLKDKSIWKVQLDTYNRELERYLPHLIEEAESLFYVDSKCSLAILNHLNKIGIEKYRWIISFKMVDSFLEDFGLSLEQKNNLLAALDSGYKREFGFNIHNSTQFNTEYRKHSPDINAVIEGKIEEDGVVKLYKLLENRTKELKPIVSKIVGVAKPNELSSLLMSYIHMMLNRLFVSSNRKYELLIYNFLSRYYTSCLARMKYNKIQI